MRKRAREFMENEKFKNIDSYIQAFPSKVQSKLEEVWKTIRKAAPDAAEAISYQIPTFKLNGNLVHFAAFKNHIGFYPGAAAMETFKHRFDDLKTSKGAVQFPLDQTLPLDLVEEITKYRVAENLKKGKRK